MRSYQYILELDESEIGKARLMQINYAEEREILFQVLDLVQYLKEGNSR